MMRQVQRSRKSGFTLIEIIAVLLILAVLAAVAVPRYLSLVQDARERALDGALAAGYSQLSLLYAREALTEGEPPTAAELIAIANVEANWPAGDFEYDYTAVGDVITVEVEDSEGNTKTGTWTLP